MPALITHHIFGEDIVSGLPAGLVTGEEELLAFLLGNQGPDPLYARFSTLPSRAAACHELARQIQGGRVTRTLLALRDGVAHLPRADERVGRAFALGIVGHYALDRAAHPFIVAQQRALEAAGAGLEGAGREIHAVIESDLDSWILWEKRRATTDERPPAGNLMRTARTERVGGALLSQVALSVYGTSVGAGEYAAAVRDYELLYRAIEPAGSARARLLGATERLVRPHSILQASAHYVRRTDECAAANLERGAWRHPFTGATRTDSFADLFDEARLAYPALAEAFVRGDEGRLRDLVAGLDFSGRPGTDN
ncbi:zinc dependent phospholipase C family protein [Olsenella uli]|uniref:zinc dependent phospholipase C family protein n=1 Tax=Olsenella uli TaxID=133926 RepID=UPI0019580346|nr:zinc dependent phospholipase C family protein [Olsenella uli]MBM6675462.1 zinc dependent phospholipase C family protein [Olsenella uli]